jgi:hypothetical protein
MDDANTECKQYRTDLSHHVSIFKLLKPPTTNAKDETECRARQINSSVFRLLGIVKLFEGSAAKSYLVN